MQMIRLTNTKYRVFCSRRTTIQIYKYYAIINPVLFTRIRWSFKRILLMQILIERFSKFELQ